MRLFKIHYAATGYGIHLYAKRIDTLPFADEAEDYTTFYEVNTRMGFEDGDAPVVYLKKGYKEAPREIVPVYRNGTGHPSYANTIADAVKLAIQDAIKYM